MAKDLDELKMIVDLAKTGGMMEARNSMMVEQLQKKDDEIAALKEMLKEKDKVIAKKDKQLAEKDKLIADKDARIKELESLVMTIETTEDGQDEARDKRTLMIVEHYILIDILKMISYVLGLNNSQKMLVAHMLHHTLADNLPQQIYEQVDEITQLEGDQTGRLAKAMEKMVEKPTTQNIVYPQAGSTANVGCDLKDTEFMVLPVNPDLPAALDINRDQSDDGREGYTEADAD
jgi:type III secretion system FlhB-like substrate exporter